MYVFQFQFYLPAILVQKLKYLREKHIISYCLNCKKIAQTWYFMLNISLNNPPELEENSFDFLYNTKAIFVFKELRHT